LCFVEEGSSKIGLEIFKQITGFVIEKGILHFCSPFNIKGYDIRPIKRFKGKSRCLEEVSLTTIKR
jgi:hypothetical protein